MDLLSKIKVMHYKDWLLGEAVKILSSLKSDESDQEYWTLGDISL